MLVGYVVLYLRTQSDAWIYQLGLGDSLSDAEVNSLVKKAEEVLRGHGAPNIRILVRDKQKRVSGSLHRCGWQEIDSIWIMERKMSLPVNPKTLAGKGKFTIVEADPRSHLNGVMSVDRGSFAVGHRVPQESLESHLSEGGAFVAISSEDNNVVGYNYNTLDTGTVGHFIRLGVDPSCRRQGIAKALIHRALDWFVNMEVPKIYLRTIPESAGAKLYETFGFFHSENERTFEIKLIPQ
ncbi:MAG TPA: GNAT family N-acetyltransferase [Candidatus Hodarchaeales archaeon]|nr:GNAT family N-acetyltransferase [Candidatus Hodarchaeales archaeon]